MPNWYSWMSSPGGRTRAEPSHLQMQTMVEKQLHAIIVDPVMRASARSRLSTRRDETISERERGGERPACSCHSGVRPRGQTYKPGMCPCARESHRSLGERPKALRGWAVVGGGGERRLTGQMMKWRSTMEARTSQHASQPCCHCLAGLWRGFRLSLQDWPCNCQMFSFRGFQTSRWESVTLSNIKTLIPRRRDLGLGERYTVPLRGAVGTITGRILSGGDGPWTFGRRHRADL